MARASLIGIDPLKIMRLNDPVEEALVVRVIERASKIASDQREELARRIINALSEAMNKSSKGRRGRRS